MAALRFGLIPRGDAGDARERDFVAAVAQALNCDVEVHRAADYRMVLAGLEQRLVDLAWLPPIVGARAIRAHLAEVVATVVRYGDTSYTTALVTRADSEIRTLGDLRNVRVAWVDRESASGYAVLRHALAKTGLRLADAFSQEIFVRSHAAVARAVLEGQVDVGATCGHSEASGIRLARSPFAGDAGLAGAELRSVFEAGPIPADLFAVHPSAPARVRTMLERALLNGIPDRVHAAARALTFADAFAAPTPEHRRMLEALVDT
jgi:phosphate/phosphite/phosphonate ABC transporter binding protein